MLVMACIATADFTKADLEAIVKEIDTVMPRDPKLNYPIQCTVETNKEVNAYASRTLRGEGEKPQAIMVVFSGLVAQAKGDKRLIRAVVAHEVAHLSAGHVTGYGFVARDLDVLYTRQQEFEADALGAAALQRLGYSKQDMVDMLLMLAELDGREGGSWWERLTADHADPKARAAEISSNPAVLQSLMSFDVGLAFADSRRWALAGRFFDDASKKEPALKEAYVNSASCALAYYYDLLPFDVRESWLRVDFGPLLTKPSVTARGNKVDDSDRRRYKAALDKISAAMTAVPGSSSLKELLAIAQVLEPDGDKGSISKGVATLRAMSTTDAWDKIRYANNAAVGLERLGDLDTGYAILIAAHRGSDAFVAAAAENLGRIRVSNRGKDDEAIACDQMYTFLLYSQSTAPYRAAVEKSYEASCKALNITPKKVDPLPTAYVRAVSVRIGGREFGLLSPVSDLVTALGQPDTRLLYEEKYPDLNELRWASTDLSVMTERGQVMRLTTYAAESYVFLQPTDRSVSGGFRVTVGMSKDDLQKVLDLQLAVPRKLVRGAKMEEWSYFPEIGFGVLLKDDKVIGLTVSPVAE